MSSEFCGNSMKLNSRTVPASSEFSSQACRCAGRAGNAALVRFWVWAGFVLALEQRMLTANAGQHGEVRDKLTRIGISPFQPLAGNPARQHAPQGTPSVRRSCHQALGPISQLGS